MDGSNLSQEQVLNLLDGMKVERTLDSGTVYSFSDAGVSGVGRDYRYMIYVPNDYDANTQVHAFMHGFDALSRSGHRDAVVPFVDSINNGNGSDDVLIFYDAQRTDFNNADDLNKLLNVSTYEPLKKLGISTNNITFEGFSAGGKTALKLTAQHLKNNPDLPPQVVVTYDATCLNYNKENPNAKLSWNAELSDDEVQALVDNHATLITFEQTGDPNYDPDNSIAVKNLTRRGVDVVYVKRNDESGHFKCLKGAVEDGAMDYLTGKTNSLRNSDNYTFMRWVPDETKTSGRQENGWWKEYGEWVPLTSHEVATLISKDLMSYVINRYENLTNIPLLQMPVLQTGALYDMGIVQSDLEYVIKNVNNLKTGIKTTGFFSTSVNTSFSSSAKMPMGIVNYMHDSLDATGLLLSKLNDATNALVKIGGIFEKLDTETSDKVDELLDNNTPIVSEDDNVVNTPSVSTDNGGGNTPIINVDENIVNTPNNNTDGNVDNTPNVNNDNNVVSTPGYNNDNNRGVYANIKSDDNREVYDIDDDVRIVINNDGTIEGYYKLDNSKNVEEITNIFKNSGMVSEVSKETDCLKLTFNKNEYDYDKFYALINNVNNNYSDLTLEDEYYL